MHGPHALHALGAAKLGHAALAAHLELLGLAAANAARTHDLALACMHAQERERSLALSRVLALLGGARKEKRALALLRGRVTTEMVGGDEQIAEANGGCLLYTSPSPRD